MARRWLVAGLLGVLGACSAAGGADAGAGGGGGGGAGGGTAGGGAGAAGGGAAGGGAAGGGDAGPAAHPISLTWTFEGLDCARAFVSTVSVSGLPPVTSMEELFPCSAQGVEGATLARRLPDGTYTVIVVGQDAQGQALYQTLTNLFVSGPTTAALDLGRGSRVSSATLTWTFPGGMDCAQAAVSAVRLVLDGVTMLDAPCASGLAPATTSLTWVPLGAHTLRLEARSAADALRFVASGPVTGAIPPGTFTFALQ